MQVSFSWSLNKQQYYQWCKLSENLYPDMIPLFVAFKQLSVFCLIILCCIIERKFLPICLIVILIIQADLIYHNTTPQRNWKRHKKLFGSEVSVLATEELLQNTCPGRVEVYRWGVFNGLSVTPYVIYLRSGYFILMYPRFCFAHEQDWTAFVELASKSIQVQPSPDKKLSTDGQKSEDMISGNYP